MNIPQSPVIKQRINYFFTCPLCKNNIDVPDADSADAIYLNHIDRDCYANPAKKICGSCEYQKSGGCKLKEIDNGIAIITSCGFYPKGCPMWKLHKRLNKYNEETK